MILTGHTCWFIEKSGYCVGILLGFSVVIYDKISVGCWLQRSFSVVVTSGCFVIMFVVTSYGMWDCLYIGMSVGILLCNYEGTFYGCSLVLGLEILIII